MSLVIASLNSGSNGNCYYVGNNTEAVLVDAGLSCRETEKRMSRIGLSMKNVKAIFISHEHGDHIKGLYSLLKKYKLPVYITDETMRNGNLNLKNHQTISFEAHKPVQIGSLTVTPFSKVHDAIDPHSFVIGNGGINVGVITDIGLACENTIHYFKQCHAAFLESNYDEQMLETGKYPLALKNRIRGGVGHISNRQACELFVNHKAPFMSHLILAHLSFHNNTPAIVNDLFAKHKGNTHIVVASRYEETPVYQIENLSGDSDKLIQPLRLKVPVKQLSLF